MNTGWALACDAPAAMSEGTNCGRKPPLHGMAPSLSKASCDARRPPIAFASHVTTGYAKGHEGISVNGHCASEIQKQLDLQT